MDKFIQMSAQIDELQAQHRFEEALRLAEALCEAVRRESGKEHPFYVLSLLRLAMLSQLLGHYRDAELYNTAIVRLLAGCSAPLMPVAAKAWNNLVGLYLTVGDYSKAERISRQAFEANRRAEEQDERGLAQSLENLAMLRLIAGDYADAEDYYSRAAEMRERHGAQSDPDYAASLNNLAGLHMKIGDYQKAGTLYDKALEIWSAAGKERELAAAKCLINRAQQYRAVGSYIEAMECYRRIMDIWRDFSGIDMPDYAMALNSCARLYTELGRYDDARPLYDDAIAILRAKLGVKSAQLAAALDNLAEWHRLQGQYKKAEPLYQEAQTIFQANFGDAHPDYATSLQNLALVLIASGHAQEGLDKLNKAASIDERTLGQAFSIGSEAQRMAYLKTVEKKFYGYLSLLLQADSLPLEARLSAFDLVLRRKALAAEALAIQRETVAGGKAEKLKPQLRELGLLRMQIAQATLAGPGPEGPQAHARSLAKWQSRKETLEAEIASHIPEMNLERRLGAVDHRSVASALPEGTTLIEFVYTPIFDFQAVASRNEKSWKAAHYVAFIMPAGDANGCRMIDLGEAEPINQMIAGFRDSIVAEGENREIDIPQDGKRISDPFDANPLRAALFDPLARILENRNLLIIAPDGDLNKLPFEVLPTAPKEYLIDKYHISYVSCGRDLLNMTGSHPGRSADAIVVADPNYDLEVGAEGEASAASTAGRRSRDLTAGSIHFERLSGTLLEGKSVAGMLGVSPWIGGDALEGRVKSIRSPGILHFATHGFFLEDQQPDPQEASLDSPESATYRLRGIHLENPLLRSGLALAGANTWLRKGSLPAAAEDGILTAEDVTGLDLQNCELVVLSACDTGLGELRRGEGVFGLRRAFVVAGAKTLVMSLWKVPDGPTCELMERFYGYLRENVPRAEALRKAQFDVRAGYPKPYNWGAFICQGNPGPLKLE